ncbi:MAG: radical SAM protein [Patescibacteria group bacterium]
MEVSYFINNVCNLSCRHCYVGTTNTVNRLTVREWQKLFKDCMGLGALTFGNVGKEPTVVWEDTLALLQWFKKEKLALPRLRYGIVTNGILLDEKRVTELAHANPTYVDISFDGNEMMHDYIRRKGSYLKTKANLDKFSTELKKRVFISFTVNALNIGTFAALVDDLYQIGIRQFLISPYVSTEVGLNDGWKELVVDDCVVVLFAKSLLAGDVVDWGHYEDLRVYLKSDYTTSHGVMAKFEREKIISRDDLMIDNYGVIFNSYHRGSNIVYFNYIPFNDSFVRSVRFSHDGYVSNCYDMFFDNEAYHQLAIGNVQQIPIQEILKSVKVRI